jgi:hypothetical protein
VGRITGIVAETHKGHPLILWGDERGERGNKAALGVLEGAGAADCPSRPSVPNDGCCEPPVGHAKERACNQEAISYLLHTSRSTFHGYNCTVLSPLHFNCMEAKLHDTHPYI